MISRFRAWPFFGLSRAVIAYALLIEVLGLASGVYFVRTSTSPGPLVLLSVAVGLVTYLLSKYVTRVTEFAYSELVNVDFSNIWSFAMVVLLPSGYAVVLTVVLTLVQRFTTQRKKLVPYKTAFDVASQLLYVGAACWVYHAISAQVGIGSGLRGVAAVLAAAVTYEVANASLFSGLLLLLAGHKEVRNQFPTLRGSFLGALGMDSVGVLIASAWQANRFLPMLGVPAVFIIRQALQFKEAQEMSRTDSKTGLVAPGYWREVAERTVDRHVQDGIPVSVLLIDLDRFKLVNDTYGHLAGDDVLREVAARLRGCVRPADVVGRFGGEEFTVLLPSADAAAALFVAERCRIAVQNGTIAAGDAMLTVTCSVGVSTSNTTDLTVLAALLENADAALYTAKNNGRNQVQAGAETPQPNPVSEQPPVRSVRR